MNYLKKNQDGTITYPYYLQNLRTENPTVSFPDQIESVANDWNCFEVISTDQPAYNTVTQTVVESTPVLKDGQYQQTWQIVELSLEQVKANKLSQIDSEWYQTLSQGWNSNQGTIGLESSDVALLAGNYLLAKEASSMNLPIPSVIDMNNNEIVFSDIQSMTLFMLQYGNYRSNLSKTYAARRKAVEDATTIEEVGVI
jgi:hypothetical protein